MHFKTCAGLCYCLILICLLFALAAMSNAIIEPQEEIEENVIDKSDTGGGNITANELIIIVLLGFAFYILFLFILFAIAFE
jgi:uncharacterized membrane protein